MENLKGHYVLYIEEILTQNFSIYNPKGNNGFFFPITE